MADKTFAAFFSYVHDDDTHDNGRLTKLRQMLEEEVRALSGEDFEIFQDYDDIHWGQKWEERLNGALDGSTFLISAVTPRYIKKEFCRKEILRFLERESKLGRNDLVLSIYYIDTDLSTTNDPVTSAISSHQYFDWRDLRHEPQTNPEVGKRIERMAREIITAMKRSKSVKTKMSIIIEKIEPADPSEVQVTVSNPATENPLPPKRIEPPTLVVDPMPRRGDYTTITKAIDSAEPGSRILIRPGLYKEAIKLEKPLELIGDGKRDEIIIEVSGDEVISFNTEFGRVANLTLRQTGGGNFFGVIIDQGYLDLEDCDMSSQSLSCIVIRNGSDPRLRRNRIHDGNESGIFVIGGKGALEDNEIFSNKLHNIAITDEGNPTLRHNRIYKGQSNGVAIYENGKGTLEDNDIYENAGNGVRISTDSNPILRHNRIRDGNTAGVYVDNDGKGVLDDNEIRGNHTVGIEVTSGSIPTVLNNTISENGYEAIWIHDNGGGIFTDNDLRNNKLGAWDIDDSSRPNSSGIGNIAE